VIYRNKRTGRVIDILSEAGGDWEPVTAKAPEVKAPDPEPKAPSKKPAPRKKPAKKE